VKRLRGVADGEIFGGGGEAFVLGPEEGVGGGDDGGEDENVVPLEAFAPEDVLLQEIVGLLVVGWLEVGEGAEVLDGAEAVGEATDGEFADDEGMNGEEVVLQERVEAGFAVAEVVAPDVCVGEDVHGTLSVVVGLVLCRLEPGVPGGDGEGRGGAGQPDEPLFTFGGDQEGEGLGDETGDVLLVGGLGGVLEEGVVDGDRGSHASKMTSKVINASVKCDEG